MGGFYCFLWERINCGRLIWFVGGFKYNIFKNGNLNFFQRCCHQSGKEHSCNSKTTKKHGFLPFFKTILEGMMVKRRQGVTICVKYYLTPPFYLAKKHRRNCECCPGHSLTNPQWSSWLESQIFRNCQLCDLKSLNCYQCLCLFVGLTMSPHPYEQLSEK